MRQERQMLRASLRTPRGQAAACGGASQAASLCRRLHPTYKDGRRTRRIGSSGGVGQPAPEAVGGKSDPLDPSRGCGASPCFAFFLPTLDAPPRAFPALLVLSLPLAALALAALAPRSRQPLLTASMIARRRDDTARTVGRARGIQPTFLNAAARFGRGITKTTLRRPHNFS